LLVLIKYFTQDLYPLCDSHRVKLIREPGSSVVACLISDTIGRDAGVYTVTASNAAGKATTNATLFVYRSPLERDSNSCSGARRARLVAHRAHQSADAAEDRA